MRSNRILVLLTYSVVILTFFLWLFSLMTFGTPQLFESCTCKNEGNLSVSSSSTEELSLINKTSETSKEKLLTTTQTTPYTFLEIFPPLKSKCKGNIFMYAVVISSKNNRNRRDKIRKSWASLRKISNSLVNSIFVINYDNKDKNVHEEFIEESKKYNDIHYSHNKDNEESLLDFYMDILKIAVKCSSAKYYIFVQDHTFINFHNIINFFSNSNNPLFCDIIRDSKVNRRKESVNYVSKKEYPKDVYPNHCRKDSPIIISSDLVQKIVKLNQKPIIRLYDVYIFGILPELFKVTPAGFPDEISHVCMKPQHVFEKNDFGFMLDEEFLPTKIWTNLMINMVHKATPKIN